MCTRPKVALVIGGGGAKGAAAVGVLKYVEQSGIPVDMVVGTSIGSIVGGLYAMGTTSEQLDSLFRTQAWGDLFTGSLMGDSIVRTLRELTGKEVSFESLNIPFRCVAVDMNTLREVVLQEGSLAQAMRASMAIPLVFKPVKMGSMRLVDGGVLNNLPVDVARDMGADIVIAIDLTVNKHEDDTSSLLSLLRPDLKKYQRNCQDADIYINPNLKGYGAQDFMPTKIAEMIALGEKAGKRSLKALKKLKKSLK
ncbi:MAG: patatin-like phospholipase family protein [Bacteroidaceae bacterium]|nr:patatin-like phospholipase family protein [Bacteroidaceae bacterium]